MTEISIEDVPEVVDIGVFTLGLTTSGGMVVILLVAIAVLGVSGWFAVQSIDRVASGDEP